jgi:MraZ protein
MAFRGTFEYSLDAKKRLNVPPKFRPALSGGLVLAKDFQPCVAIWARDAFDHHQDLYTQGFHPMSADRQKIVRFFSHGSFDAELDSAGRVTLNQVLLDYAGIEKDVVVAGTLDHVQVWNPESWRADQAELPAAVMSIGESFGHPG